MFSVVFICLYFYFFKVIKIYCISTKIVHCRDILAHSWTDHWLPTHWGTVAANLLEHIRPLYKTSTDRWEDYSRHQCFLFVYALFLVPVVSVTDSNLEFQIHGNTFFKVFFRFPKMSVKPFVKPT